MRNHERNAAVPDGFMSLTGMDSGRSPSLLDPTQSAYAINTAFRGGFAQPRPGIDDDGESVF